MAAQQAPGGTDSSPGSGNTPQVTPNWMAERDSGHVWSAISNLNKQTGELVAAIQANNQALQDVRQDIKDLSKYLTELQTQTQTQMGFVKGAVWFGGIAMAVVSAVTIWAWGSILQPGIAHAIVDQLRPEITKQVSDAVKSVAPSNTRKP